MEKTKVIVPQTKMVKFDFNDTEIIVDPLISSRSKLSLAKAFMDVFMDDNLELTEKYFKSRFVIFAGVVDLNTNISIEEFEIDMLTSRLWEEVRSKILNLDEFMKELDEIKQIYLNERMVKSSVGETLDKLFAQSTVFFEKVSSVDLSKDGIKELINALNQEKQKFDTIIPQPKPTRKKRTQSS